MISGDNENDDVFSIAENGHLKVGFPWSNYRHYVLSELKRQAEEHESLENEYREFKGQVKQQIADIKSKQAVLSAAYGAGGAILLWVLTNLTKFAKFVPGG